MCGWSRGSKAFTPKCLWFPFHIACLRTENNFWIAYILWSASCPHILCGPRSFPWTHGKSQVEPFLSYPWVKAKEGRKKKKHEVGVWICPKRRNKRHFALLPLFLEFFTMTQHSLPKLWGFVFWFGVFLFYFILFPQRIESPLSWRQVWTYSVCRWRGAPGNSSGRAIRNRKSSIARHKSNHASQRWITTGGVKKAQT